MKLNLEYSYPAPVEQVYALVTDLAFRREACESSGASDSSVSVDASGDSADVRIERTMPAEVPDFVKKLTGDTVTSVQVEKWRAPAADGSRTAEVSMDVKGQPATMRGTAQLIADGDGTKFTLDAEVRVSIPLIGKRIEPEVAKAVQQALDFDVELGKTKL
jgi:hypothetical protein